MVIELGQLIHIIIIIGNIYRKKLVHLEDWVFKHQSKTSYGKFFQILLIVKTKTIKNNSGHVSGSLPKVFCFTLSSRSNFEQQRDHEENFEKFVYLCRDSVFFYFLFIFYFWIAVEFLDQKTKCFKIGGRKRQKAIYLKKQVLFIGSLSFEHSNWQANLIFTQYDLESFCNAKESVFDEIYILETNLIFKRSLYEVYLAPHWEVFIANFTFM